MQLYTLCHTLLVRDEEIVAYETYSVADSLGELRPALPVVLSQRVLYRDYRILVKESLYILDHLVGGLLALAGACEIVDLLVRVVELR